MSRSLRLTEPQLKSLIARGEASKKRKPRAIVPTEHQEQKKLIQWCDQHPIAKHIFAIPNGSHKSPAMAAKFKREGLRSGVPDLFLPVAVEASKGFWWHGLFIEMKRTKASVVSEAQSKWVQILGHAGYVVQTAKGAEQAIAMIEAYLSAPDKIDMKPLTTKE